MPNDETEPTADRLIGMVEKIAQDLKLKPEYREHTARLARSMRALQKMPEPLTATEVLLLLLGWNLARSAESDDAQR